MTGHVQAAHGAITQAKLHELRHRSLMVPDVKVNKHLSTFDHLIAYLAMLGGYSPRVIRYRH